MAALKMFMHQLKRESILPIDDDSLQQDNCKSSSHNKISSFKSSSHHTVSRWDSTKSLKAFHKVDSELSNPASMKNQNNPPSCPRRRGSNETTGALSTSWNHFSISSENGYEDSIDGNIYTHAQQPTINNSDSFDLKNDHDETQDYDLKKVSNASIIASPSSHHCNIFEASCSEVSEVTFETSCHNSGIDEPTAVGNRWQNSSVRNCDNIHDLSKHMMMIRNNRSLLDLGNAIDKECQDIDNESCCSFANE